MALMSFDEVRSAALARGRKRVAVAGAEDETVLAALAEAKAAGLVEPVAVGASAKVRELAGRIGASLDGWRLVEAATPEEAAEKAVRRVREGEADIYMKGNVSTEAFMRAVLNRDWGLRTGRVISHAAVIWSAKLRRTIILTDGGINIQPKLAEKAEILRNALPLAKALGSGRPKVAVMAAVEKVNAKMAATTDAAALAQMAADGQFGECDVAGPVAVDIAVSEDAAGKKGISNPVAGRAEVMLVPDIHSGNLMGKAIMYFAECRFGGVVVGTSAPAVFLSRSDSAETRLDTLALGVLTAGRV